MSKQVTTTAKSGLMADNQYGKIYSSSPAGPWGNTSGYVNGEVLLGSRSFPVNLGHTKPEIQSIEAFGQSLTLYPQTATSTGSVGSDKILLPYELLRENNNFQINLKGGWNLGGNIPRRERVLNLTLQYAQYQLFTRTLFAKSTR